VGEIFRGGKATMNMDQLAKQIREYNDYVDVTVAQGKSPASPEEYWRAKRHLRTLWIVGAIVGILIGIVLSH
jgi:hypothetical protein